MRLNTEKKSPKDLGKDKAGRRNSKRAALRWEEGWDAGAGARPVPATAMRVSSRRWSHKTGCHKPGCIGSYKRWCGVFIFI